MCVNPRERERERDKNSATNKFAEEWLLLSTYPFYHSPNPPILPSTLQRVFCNVIFTQAASQQKVNQKATEKEQ
jgi:hypothetical protein